VAALREAMKGEDVQRIQQATQRVTQVASRLTEAVSHASAAESASSSAGPASAGEPDVVDAEFEDVDDHSNRKAG
jgi:molecular chaperone DnaK